MDDFLGKKRFKKRGGGIKGPKNMNDLNLFYGRWSSYGGLTRGIFGIETPPISRILTKITVKNRELNVSPSLNIVFEYKIINPSNKNILLTFWSWKS